MKSSRASKALWVVAALLSVCALPGSQARAPGSIDLEVLAQSISLDPGHPGELRTNDNITITVPVGNLGDEPALNVTVQVLFNTSDMAPQLVGFYLFNSTGAEISPNSTESAVLHWNTSGLGLEPYTSYTLWVNAINDTQPESQWDPNPDNNRARLNFTLLPDVIPLVEGLEADKVQAIVGETIHLTATLNNTGIRPAVGEPVEFYLDQEARPFNTTSADVPPGVETRVSCLLDTSRLIDGPHLVTARVRSSAASLQLSLKYLTNPHITSISPSTRHATIGDPVMINMTLENNGTESATMVRVDLYLDAGGTPIGNLTVEEAPVGSMTNVSYIWDTTGALPGNHTVRARVESTGSELRTANITLVERPLPDLTILNISLSSYSPLVGELVRVDINISNVGEGGMTASTTLKLWLDAEIDPIFQANINPLEPGEGVVVEFDWDTTGLTPFKHSLFAYINPDAELEESNDTNNDFRVEAHFEGRVDLVVDAVTLSLSTNQSNSTSEFTAGDRVWVWVRVENRGSLSSASNTTLELYLDAGATPICTFSLNPISAGGSSTPYFEWDTSFFNDSTSTNHTIRAVVDPDDKNEELNETNNELSAPLTVHPYIPEADLVVVETSVSKTKVSYQETVLILAHIANLGGRPANNVTVRFMYIKGSSPQLLEDQRIPVVLPGEHINRSRSWQVLVSPGNYTVEVQLDPQNSIREVTKDNNVATASLEVLAVEVREPRLEITSLSYRPNRPSAGEMVRVNITVRNSGTAEARFIVVTLLVDGKPGPSYSLAQLDPGGVATVSLEWRARGGSHTLGASATAAGLEAVSGPTARVGVSTEEAGWAGALVVAAILTALIVAAAALFARGASVGADREKKEEE
ncbi:MAG: CARDB domain-containing protein [Thermoplasmatota archaeon]